jgi:hypothetical protein
MNAQREEIQRILGIWLSEKTKTCFSATLSFVAFPQLVLIVA